MNWMWFRHYNEHLVGNKGTHLGNYVNWPRERRGWAYAFAGVKRINGEVNGRTMMVVVMTHDGYD